ncbi:MAG: GSU2204 family CXXCH-containing (seleno)protein [Acidobacteriota bacterium]
MSLRRALTLALSLATIAVLSAAVAAQAPDKTTEGIVVLGANVGGNTDTMNRVAEYDVARDGTLPALGARLWGNNGTFTFDLLASHGGDSRDQKYAASISAAGGRVKASFGFDRFLHRLDHDPLDYVGGSIATFVVHATDHDAGSDYSTINGMWNANVDVAATEHLSFFVSHKMQMRDGTHQAMTTSHCANCHIESYGRKLDQTTQALALGARVAAGRFSADYTYENRTFRDDESTPTHVYDKAVHPQTLADVFLNRVSYDQRSGALPFDLVPEFTKQTNTVRAAVALPNEGAISGNFTRSSSHNDNAGMGAEFTGASGRFTFPLGKRAVVKAFLRRYDIETESVFVDIGEAVAPAGPAAGLTYQQVFPAMGDVDYFTESTGSRTPTEAAIELALRPGKRSSINLGYVFEQVNRTNFHVEKSTTNLFKAAAYFRPTRTLSLRARYEQAMTTDPFANIHAAKPAILQYGPSPGGLPFAGLQYFEMYGSRSVNFAASPTDSLLFDAGATWAPSQEFSVSGHYRVRDMKNDALNASTWDHTIHMPGFEVYVAPTDRFTLAAGWGYQRDTLNTVFSTLNFVG